MGEKAELVKSWRVGKRRVTLTVAQPKAGQVVHSVFEWEPDVPRRLSGRELKQYRAGRDAAFAEVFAEAGVKGMVLEI